MSNYKFNIWVEPKDIYDKIFPEQKEQFSNISFLNAILRSDGNVEIECLASESKIEECSFIQKLIGDGCITVRDF